MSLISDSEILAAIATRLTGKTLAEDRIFECRFLPIQPEEVPCINIVPGNASYAKDNGETHNNGDRQFTIVIYAKGDEKADVVDTGNDPIFDRLESMKNTIRTEFNNIFENLGQLVYRMDITSTRPEIKTEADWVYGLLYMTYSIQTKEKIYDPKSRSNP